jgi:glycosyltransferase involved in cell wall biosynthesis
MASALPVIVTDHCPTEYVNDAGLVVPIRDPNAIADQIRYLYDNPQEARNMGQRGRKIVEQNTWDDFSTRVMEVHKEILQREDHV